MSNKLPQLDLGYVVTGVVEVDPMTGNYVLRTQDENGNPQTFDVQASLAKYKGKEVRYTIASMETIAQLTELVESGGVGEN